MGTLQFSLYRASNVLGSYKVFREIVGNLTMEFCNANYSEAILESCFGSRAFDAVQSEASLDGLSSQSKWSVLVDSPGGVMFNRNLIKRLTKVTVWDVSKAIKKYFSDFMYPEK